MFDYTDFTSRLKISLVTETDVLTCVRLANSLPKDEFKLVIIDDGAGMVIDPRSFLGCMYAREFKDMWLLSNNDKIHTVFRDLAID